MGHQIENQKDEGPRSYCLLTAVEQIQKNFANERKKLQAQKDELAVKVIQILAS